MFIKVGLQTLLMFGIALATTSVSSSNGSEGGTIYNATYLGSVDGKSYYYEKEFRRWRDGQRMCQEAGMDLATITSPEQAAFLKASFNVLDDNAFWVDARESQTLSRFSWNKSGQSLNESIVSLDPLYTPPIAYCLIYHSNASPDSVCMTRSCLDILTFTLCEIEN